MIDVAIAIDGEAIPIIRSRSAPGFYDVNGDFIRGQSARAKIMATIQPVRGNQLMDMPEGIRTEAGWMIWSRSEIRLDDVIGSTGGGFLSFGPYLLLFAGNQLVFNAQPAIDSITYRVLYVWPRMEGGFYRAALGRDVP